MSNSVAAEIDEEELYKRVFGRTKPKVGFEERVFDPSDPLSLFERIFEFISHSLEPRNELEKRVRRLEKEIEQLKKRMVPQRVFTKADIIYEKYRDKLERNYFGKIVAIDTETKRIVGIGNTILEAYEMARKKTSKNKFSFKKVGYPYVYKLV